MHFANKFAQSRLSPYKRKKRSPLMRASSQRELIFSLAWLVVFAQIGVVSHFLKKSKIGDPEKVRKIEAAEKSIYDLDMEQIRKEEMYDGFYAVITNLEGGCQRDFKDQQTALGNRRKLSDHENRIRSAPGIRPEG